MNKTNLNREKIIFIFGDHGLLKLYNIKNERKMNPHLLAVGFKNENKRPQPEVALWLF